MASLGDCPICNKKFPMGELEAHVELCLSGGGAAQSSHDSDFELAKRLAAEDSGSVSTPMDTDAEFARRLYEEEQKAASGNRTQSPSHKTVDADEEFARRLQAEERQKSESRGVACQVCGNLTPVDRLYILDDCTHKFCKACLKASVTKQVSTSCTTVCPIPGCNAALSVRDMGDLLPKAADLPHGSGTAQATERLLSELKYIMKTKPEKQGYSVAPIKDNLYHWEVRFFDFDKKDPIGQDLAKMKNKHITLDITFPKTYPFHPPFIRVLRPRFAFRTGHVTVGGSICTELLTNTGWSPANTVEAVLVNIRANLIEGGARLDFANKSDYTEAEAKEAFERMRQQHGW